MEVSIFVGPQPAVIMEVGVTKYMPSTSRAQSMISKRLSLDGVRMFSVGRLEIYKPIPVSTLQRGQVRCS